MISVWPVVREFARGGDAVREAAVLALCCATWRSASAQDLPAGARLRVRLDDAVSTSDARPGDSLRAHVIAATGGDESVAVRPGTRIMAVVRDVRMGAHGGARHVLGLDFVDVVADDGSHIPVRSRIEEIHDVREALDTAGHLLGLPPPLSPRSKRTWALMVLGSVHPAAAAILFATLEGIDLERHRATRLASGTDVSIVLQEPLRIAHRIPYAPPPPVDPTDSIAEIVARLPRQARALDGSVASDLVNLVLVGDSAAIDDAFERAGWTQPDAMGVASVARSFAAEAAARGYAGQPVSAQLIDGQMPVRAFQRVNNTFAKRHHLRVWRTAERWHGRPVWIAAATHDIAITFSTRHRAFAHEVDPRIDLERDFVADDLVAAGVVARRSSLPLAPVPDATVNLDHTPVVTDSRVVVLELQAVDATGSAVGGGRNR